MKRTLIIISCIVATLTLGACTTKETTTNNNITSRCGENYELQFETASVCFVGEDSFGFKKNRNVYESYQIHVNEPSHIKLILKNELDELAEVIEETDTIAQTFMFQNNGTEVINGIEFIKFAHGYVPIGAEIPIEYNEMTASVTGYSYAYAINDEQYILFDSGASYYADGWIQDIVGSIEK